MGPKRDFHGAAGDDPAHRTARQLQVNIAVVARWLGTLQDPQFADVGQHFQARCAQGGFQVALDPDLTCTASYCSFSLRKDQSGFVNTITYGQLAAKNPVRLFNAAIHEPLHGLQKQNAAALHASPFNAVNGNTIIICPRDWLLLEERCEQDAYAKQAWMNALLARHVQKAWDSGKNGPLSAREFQSCRDVCGDDLVAGLRLAAAKALHKSYWYNNENSPYRFANYVQDCALRNYRAAMKLRLGDGETGFVFVRVRPEHVHALGQSFGPNVFGDNPKDPSLLQQTAMSDSAAESDEAMGTSYGLSTAALFDQLQQDLGIRDDSALPYLDEALAQRGLSMEQYIHQTSVPALAVQSNLPPAITGP